MSTFGQIEIFNSINLWVFHSKGMKNNLLKELEFLLKWNEETWSTREEKVYILLLQIVKVEQIPFLSAFYEKKLSEQCCYILFEHSKIIKRNLEHSFFCYKITHCGKTLPVWKWAFKKRLHFPGITSIKLCLLTGQKRSFTKTQFLWIWRKETFSLRESGRTTGWNNSIILALAFSQEISSMFHLIPVCKKCKRFYKVILISIISAVLKACRNRFFYKFILSIC